MKLNHKFLFEKAPLSCLLLIKCYRLVILIIRPAFDSMSLIKL